MCDIRSTAWKINTPSWYREGIVLNPNSDEVLKMMSHFFTLGFSNEVKISAETYYAEQAMSLHLDHCDESPPNFKDEEAWSQNGENFATIFEVEMEQDAFSEMDKRITCGVEKAKQFASGVGYPMIPFSGVKGPFGGKRMGWRWAQLPIFHPEKVKWDRYKYKRASTYYTWPEFEITPSLGKGDGIVLLADTQSGFLIPFLGFPMGDDEWFGLKKSKDCIEHPFSYIAYCDIEGKMKYVDGHPRRVKRGAVWLWPGAYANQTNTPGEVNAKLIRVNKEQYDAMPAYPRFGADLKTGKEGVEVSRLAVLLMRDMKKGEEVLVDYGWTEEDQMYRKCGYLYWYNQHRDEDGVYHPNTYLEQPESRSSNSSATETPLSITSIITLR